MNRDSIGHVVLLDEAGSPIGITSKASVHGADTPLHLAFSCHVRNPDGLVLITRRSLAKKTWPGVWSNSFCGHPRPAEPVRSAVTRHAEHELGILLTDVELSLPLFRYRAVDPAGVVENEICPVFVAETTDEINPRPDEVMEYAWVDPIDLGRSIRLTPWVFSPWLVLQAQLLPLLGGVAPVTQAAQRELAG
jgi:isopentenyl-diphosphate delta-isomerase